MTTDTRVLAAYELDMFEARNAALRELLAADAEMNEALAMFSPGLERDAVVRGLRDWVTAFSVLARVSAAGNDPKAHPGYVVCQEAGDDVDIALGGLPYVPARDALVLAIREWIEAQRTVAAYRHVPPRAWWRDD